MMPQDIHLIADFIQAKNDHNRQGFAELFAEDAVVHDEGENEDHQGISAIKAWANKIFQSYKLVTKPTAITQDNGMIILTALVSGDFPGSPIEFSFYLIIKDRKITELRIK